MRTWTCIAILASCAHPSGSTDAMRSDVLPDSAAPASCNPTTGRTSPLPTCTTADPCTHPLALLGTAPITSPVTMPTCDTSQASHPSYDDGPPEQFTPADGVTRYACVFHPPGAAAGSPRPLLIFIPGSGGSAQNVYDYTLLRDKAVAYDLTGDATRPGFHLVSVGARNLHWPDPTPEDGPKADYQFRDLASPSTNPDIANLDRLVDELAADPAVDPARIYITGWSNGGRFAQLYAIARHERATPSGHRVAAVAVYSAGDPFNQTPDLPDPSCALNPYPRSTVPLMIVSRACDLFPCSDAQAAAISVSEPGSVVPDWLADVATKVGDPTARWLILDGMGSVTTACNMTASCTETVAVANHVRWPDGLAKGDGGHDHEPEMLAFLRIHPAM
jgi:poly(3-hydroxybutyrate) depolymerase